MFSVLSRFWILQFHFLLAGSCGRLTVPMKERTPQGIKPFLHFQSNFFFTKRFHVQYVIHSPAIWVIGDRNNGNNNNILDIVEWKNPVTKYRIVCGSIQHTPDIWKVQNRQIYRDQKRPEVEHSGNLGLAILREVGNDCWWAWRIFLVWWKYSKTDDCTTLWTY